MSALLLIGATPSQSFAQADGAAPEEAVCAQARALNVAALPQQALALVDKVNESTRTEGAEDAQQTLASDRLGCVEERNEALRRISVAEQMAVLAARVQPEGSVTPGTAAGSVTAGTSAQTPSCPAQATGQGISAATRAELADIAKGCDSEVVIAEPKTPSQSLASNWSGFAEANIAPLNEPAVASMLLIGVGLIVARLIAPQVGRLDKRTRRQDPRVSIEITRRMRLRSLLVGLALLIAAGIIAVTESPAETSSLQQWLLPVVPMLFGSLFLAWAFSQATRVVVRVIGADGKEDSGEAAHVIALARDLGGAAPVGIEYPLGTDETILQAAGFTTTPEGRVAKALYNLIHLMVPRSPWDVSVGVNSRDLIAVTVSHHGREVRSAAIDRDVLGLRIPVTDSAGVPMKGADGKEKFPELQRMTAAVILAALHEEYEMPRLYGATQWKSLGLHYVATTDLATSKPSVDVLAQAVDADPSNRAAHLALWHHRYRTSDHLPELLAYINLLNNIIEETEADPETYYPLALRARHSYLVASINAMYLEPGGPPLPAILRPAAASTLEMTENWSRKDDAALAQRTKRSLEAIVAFTNLGPVAYPPDITVPSGTADPYAEYSWACYYACRPEYGGIEDVDYARALEHLRAATAHPDLSQWHRKDPQLKKFRTHLRYREAFNRAPATDFLSLPTLAADKDGLASVGASTPQSVMAQRPWRLAAHLGRSTARADYIRAVASLALSVPDDLATWRIDITRTLLERNVIAVQPGTLGDFVSSLRNDLLRDLNDVPTEEQLRTWLGDAPAG
ncbi:hypothetical protein [Georgenia sp. AZ-5]|uniref:hypothetical protein n=1 Tax=Georgenia sp. AZ-5 TaxID=3367526 RepID=UPI003755165C